MNQRILVNNTKLPNLNAGGVLGKYEIQKGLASTRIKDLPRMQFDLDVYLPSRGMNLQRPFVWSLPQQEAFIESILLRRHSPPISFIFTEEDKNQVIDGKQRISTLSRYLANEFSYCGYFYKDLPTEYKFRFDNTWLIGDRLVEPFGNPLTDDEKVEWFYWLNFAGTEQDVSHRQALMRSHGT